MRIQFSTGSFWSLITRTMGLHSGGEFEKESILMKPIAGGALLGLLIALVIIYFLRPLNNGAIGLIILICISVFGALGKLMRGKKK